MFQFSHPVAIRTLLAFDTISPCTLLAFDDEIHPRKVRIEENMLTNNNKTCSETINALRTWKSFH